MAASALQAGGPQVTRAARTDTALATPRPWGVTVFIAFCSKGSWLFLEDG